MSTEITGAANALNVSNPHTLLRTLDQIEGKDLPLVGGKAYRLALLKQHGLNVPAGLVLTTHFFETHLKHARLTPLWAGSPDVAVTAEALSWLADALKTRPLSRPLAQELTTQLAAVFGPTVDNFAVRSSVIDEDQRDHTFAGVHLTELGVPRVALPIAISRCWASALSLPAIQYRQVHGMSIQGIRIAVLIQPMLTPQSSGVGFTLNPLTGSRTELVIEATWGLGNKLVGGEVQPCFYRLANQPPHYPTLEERAGAGPDDAVNLLPPSVRQELAGQLRQIEALMGEPQDVEWARQNGRIFLLQTRPVMAFDEPKELPNPTWTRSYPWEGLPELPSPFYASLIEQSQPQTLKFFQDIGFVTEGSNTFETLVFGRPYLNSSLVKRLLTQIGLQLDSQTQPASFVDAIAASRRMPGLDWRTAWQARRIYRQMIDFARHPGHYLAATEQQVANLIGQLSLDLPANAEAAAVLVEQLHHHVELHHQLSLARLRLELATALTTATGGRLLASHTSTPASLLTSQAHQQSATLMNSLHKTMQPLVDLVLADDQLRQHLLSSDAGQVLQHLDDFPAFQRQFAETLARLSSRAACEADPACPRYAEAPGQLVADVQQVLPRQVALQSISPHPTPDSTPPAEPSASLGWQSWLATPLISRLSELMTLRQQLHELMAQTMTTCRRWLLNIGAQWAAWGWLADPADIFWLSVAEIERNLLAGQMVAVSLAATVQARKDTYRSYAQMVVPFSLQHNQLTSIQLGLESMAAPTDVIIGQPISPGQARGVVVVVRRPDQLALPNDEVILVMPSTGPNWLPLLHQAAGLIVETGGLLSHGSVIAREYGLPAVANIPQATQRFTTGDRVLVDGSTGVIQLLEAAQPASSD